MWRAGGRGGVGGGGVGREGGGEGTGELCREGEGGMGGKGGGEVRREGVVREGVGMRQVEPDVGGENVECGGEGTGLSPGTSPDATVSSNKDNSPRSGGLTKAPGGKASWRISEGLSHIAGKEKVSFNFCL